MNCDMHVHSKFSGAIHLPVLRLFCRECYSEPAEVYATLKRRGMDLVTLTDHDSIEGSEELRRHPDFFLSEEVTCRMPSGTEAHLGVYDITEHQHIELQRRRGDFPALLAYLREQQLFFSLNHAFSLLTGRRTRDDFRLFEEHFQAVETHNGLMPTESNRHAVRFARRTRKARVAGSDAHTLASAGSAYTEVPGVASKEEFLHGLRNRLGRPRGDMGSYAKLTRDVLLVTAQMFRAEKWPLLIAPIAALIPLYTLGNYVGERWFARRWAAAVLPEWSSRMERRERLTRGARTSLGLAKAAAEELP